MANNIETLCCTAEGKELGKIIDVLSPAQLHTLWSLLNKFYEKQ